MVHRGRQAILVIFCRGGFVARINSLIATGINEELKRTEFDGVFLQKTQTSNR